MTRPILVSSQDYDDDARGRAESPETILDSEEERQEFYLVQREKRRKRKLEKRGTSGETSGSGSGRERSLVRGDNDSVRFLGATWGREAAVVVLDDDEIEVINVVPTAPVLRAPSTSLQGDGSEVRGPIHGDATDEDDPSGLRANLAKFKYALAARGAPIPTSRAAVAAIKARAMVSAGGADEPLVVPSPARSARKRVVRGKTSVPEMPVEPEQLKELDACVVCEMAFDRRKTAKTRWVSTLHNVT